MGASWALGMDPEAVPDPDPAPDELSGPNQGPLPSRPGKKYVTQGTLAATYMDHARAS